MVSGRLFHCKLTLFLCRLMSHLEGDNLKLCKDPIGYRTFIHLFICNSIDSEFSISFNELKLITMMMMMMIFNYEFVPDLVCGNTFWLATMSFWHIPVILGPCSYAQVVSDSIFTFPDPTLQSIISQGSPGFFLGRMAFWSQDQSAGCAYYSWGDAALRPS